MVLRKINPLKSGAVVSEARYQGRTCCWDKGAERVMELLGSFWRMVLSETSFLGHAFIFSLCTWIIKGALKSSSFHTPKESVYSNSARKCEHHPELCRAPNQNGNSDKVTSPDTISTHHKMYKSRRVMGMLGLR